MNRLWQFAMVLLASFAFCAPALAQPPVSHGAAKKLIADIHEEIEHQTTVYCGCPYVRTTRSGGDLTREDCGLTARSSDERSDALHWEHVVPAAWIGEQHACWNDGHELCVDDDRPYKGRDCCTKAGIDPKFMEKYNDLHNLFPASGEINIDRLNHPYGEVQGEPRAYGACDFEMRRSPTVAEPAKCVRGELARAMLYMIDQFGVDVRMSRDQLMSWHELDPPEPWEIERARRIEAVTGRINHYLTTSDD